MTFPVQGRSFWLLQSINFLEGLWRWPSGKFSGCLIALEMVLSPLRYGATGVMFVSLTSTLRFQTSAASMTLFMALLVLIATAVVMSVTASAPFGGQKDVDLGIAYVSAFILIFWVSFRYSCPMPDESDPDPCFASEDNLVPFGRTSFDREGLQRSRPRT